MNKLIKSMRMVLYKRAIPVVLLVVMGGALTMLHAGGSKNIVLVLDTSMSMIGYGGKNILPQVKDKIGKFIDQEIKDGDKVTFITFDEATRVYPTVLVDDVNDRDIIKKYISVTDAKGKWTYTSAMMQIAYDKAVELESQESDRQVVIVIMTDAVDDPPPGTKDRMNIEKLNDVQKKDWWVYMVNFGSLKNDEKFKRITKFAKHAEVINANADAGKGMEGMQQALRQTEERESSPLVPILIALFTIAAVILLLVLFWRYSKLKVQGKLEYWNNGLLDPYTETVDMSKRHLREVAVGNGVGSIIHIRDLEIPKPFHIVAVREKGEVKMALKPGSDYLIEFVNRQTGNILEDGDIFKVGNYSFKYTVS